MPLELRELVIRTEVTEVPDARPSFGNSPTLDGPERRRLIEDCVKEVFRALRNEESR